MKIKEFEILNLSAIRTNFETYFPAMEIRNKGFAFSKMT